MRALLGKYRSCVTVVRQIPTQRRIAVTPIDSDGTRGEDSTLPTITMVFDEDEGGDADTDGDGI